MIIGIDASKAAESKKTGVEYAVYQLILNLKKIDKKNTYFLYTNKHLPKELLSQANFHEVYIPFPKFWNKIRLPLSLIFSRPNVYLSPSYTLPYFAPKKSVYIVHDLASFHFPKSYSLSQRLSQKNALSYSCKHALKLICVSNYTADDLTSLIPSVKNKIEIVHLAYNAEYFHQIENLGDPLKLDAPFILYVGRLEVRKNVLRLVSAYIKLKETKDVHHKLVLVGQPGYGYDKIHHLIETSKFKDEIILPGHIENKNLPELFARADLFAFPSLYEGFGIPVLEAMAVGTPVLTSNCSSLPEVTGEAALKIDPLDVDAIADGMYRVIQDKSYANELKAAGFAQVKKFSWDTTATKILNIMEKL